MRIRISARALAAAMALIACGIVLAADIGLPLPARRILALPLVDKAGHFALFGMLSWLTVRAALEAASSRPRAWIAAAWSALLFAVAAMEEFSQRYIRSRTFSLWDLAASAAGIIVLAAAQLWFSRRRALRAEAAIRGRRA